MMERWKERAQAEPDSRRRSDYAGLALVFAELAGCWETWKQALKGWNVEQSQQVLEWQAEAEAIGMTKGQAEALVKLLRKRLTPKLPPELESLVRKTKDIALLDHWTDLALKANSIEEFQHLMGDPPIAP